MSSLFLMIFCFLLILKLSTALRIQLRKTRIAQLEICYHLLAATCSLFANIKEIPSHSLKKQFAIKNLDLDVSNSIAFVKLQQATIIYKQKLILFEIQANRA